MGSNSTSWTDNHSAEKLRIAVIADTHNRIPDRLTQRLEIADEIWHLGDVCRPDTLHVISKLGAPLYVVQGNNDPYFHWQEQLVLERRGRLFKLQHLPPHEGDSSVTAILFAHTHVPSKQHTVNSIALNPGAITAPRNGSRASFAWITIDSGGGWIWEVEPLSD